MRSIEFYLNKWGLTADEVPVKSFFCEQQIKACESISPDSVHLFIIKLNQYGRIAGVT